MSRDVSAPTIAAAGAGVSRPAWFLEINWPDFSTRLCSYGEQTWNDLLWAGGGFEVAGFDRDGKPTQVSLVDPGHDYRTLVLGVGLRDRLVRLWKGYIDALADDDPVLIFEGYADGFDIANNRLGFGLDWNASARQFSPRAIIGPSIGVNFTGIPNTTFTWNDTVFKMIARPRD